MNEDHKKIIKSKEDKLAIEIGQRLLEARNGLGWSQQVLHEKTRLHDSDGVGISRAVLSLYERGVNKPGSREITILCPTLKISSNWLLFGSESPSKILEPSSVFLQGDDLTISVRLALGLLALSSTERDSLTSLLFSLLTRTLGDYRLSSLMHMAQTITPGILEKIKDEVGSEADQLTLSELLEKFTNSAADALYTNYGTLRPLISEEELDTFDPEFAPPPRTLKIKEK